MTNHYTHWSTECIESVRIPIPIRRFAFDTSLTTNDAVQIVSNAILLDLKPSQRIFTPGGGFEGSVLNKGFHIIRRADRRDFSVTTIVYGQFRPFTNHLHIAIIMVASPFDMGAIGIASILLLVSLKWLSILPISVLWMLIYFGFNIEAKKATSFLRNLFENYRFDPSSAFPHGDEHQ